MTRTFLCVSMCVGLVCVWPFVSTAHGADERSKGGIESALNRTVKSYRFSGTFGKCLVDLTKLARVPIIGDWKTLQIVGVTKDTRISMNVEGARVSQLLDVAMAKARPKGIRLGWIIDGGLGAVRVTSQRAALASRSTASAAGRAAGRKGYTAPSIRFDQTPLGQVVQTFREMSGMNFYVNWRALAEINVDRDTPVTLNVSGVTTAQALDLVTDALSDNLDKFQRAYWVVDNGVVRISTGTALNTKLKTRTFELGALMMPMPTVKMPRRIGLRGTRDSNTNDRRYDSSRSRDRDRDGGRRIGTITQGAGLGIIGGGAGGDSDAEQSAEEMRENIIGVIKDSIGEDMWEPSGKGSVRIIRNRLVISQTMLGYKLLDRSLRSKGR